jgi:hypothetical protein
MDPKLSEVIAYLTSEFPGYAVTWADKGDFLVFQVASSDRVHNLHVQRTFLQSTPAEDIREHLIGFRLAPTLRDLGNLPILVTLSGCIYP